MSVAFNTISYDILLHCLVDVGICGRAWDWVKSFLENSKQVVTMGLFWSNGKTTEMWCLSGFIWALHCSTYTCFPLLHLWNPLVSLLYNMLMIPNWFSLNKNSSNFEENVKNCLSQNNSWMNGNHFNLTQTKHKFSVFVRTTRFLLWFDGRMIFLRLQFHSSEEPWSEIWWISFFQSPGQHSLSVLFD